MNDELPDPLLDAKLREVPLPEDLLARLRTTSVPDNGELDDALRHVPLPHDFSLRLQAHIDDMMLDDVLSDVVVPANLLARLHVIPEVRPPARWRRLALAACLMVVIGGLYGLTLKAVMNAIRPQPAVAETVPLIDLGPLQLELRQTVAPVVHVRLESNLPPTPFRPTQAEPDEIAVELIPFGRRTLLGAAGQMIALHGTDLKLDDDVFLLRWGALGAPRYEDTPLPDLERVAAPRGPAVDLPRVPGYDRVFWLKQGIHPPVWPSIHPALQASRLLVTNRTDSVELTRRRIAVGRIPDPTEIRVEDFLAAVNYHFPRPQQGSIGIRTAAGPALFAHQQHHLLQIGIKAGRAPRQRKATHLTVALDISTSMGAGNRLEMAKQALAGLADNAGPLDRISLVAFHHDVLPLTEALNREQLGQLPAIMASLKATGGDNLAGGLQQAVSTLLGSGLDDQFERNLVVLTDGQNNLSAAASGLAHNVLEVAAEHQIQSTFIQIGACSNTPPLTGAVTWVCAETAQDALWGLLEGLTGGSVAVAERPVLAVEFNPAAVQAYRLVGYETTAETVPETTTLHNGEEATALYEVWLRPNNAEDIAWVRAQWRDPRTGGHRESRPQRVSRLQFATSVGEMPLSLQAAAVAAEFGKILSEAYDFELSAATTLRKQKKSRDLRALVAACHNLNPSLDSWSEFQDLIGLLAALDNVRRNQTP